MLNYLQIKRTLLSTIISVLLFSGCDEVPFVVEYPLIDTIICDKPLDYTVRQSLAISDGYTASYFIPPNYLTTPSDIALTPTGEIFVCEVRGGGISRVSSTGDISFWANTDHGIYSISLDNTGYLYAYFMPDGDLLKIAPDGSVSVVLENDPRIETPMESSIAVNPVTNELYIIKNPSNNNETTLYKLSGSDLVVVKENMNFTTAIAFNNQGELFLAMSFSIKQLDLTDLTLRTVASLPNWQAINHHSLAIDPSGNFYASTGSKLYRISPSGETVLLVTGFTNLEGIKADSDNTIYAVDRGSSGLYQISENLRRAECLVPPNNLSTPQAMKFNSEGKLYIAQDEIGKIGIYSASGEVDSYLLAIVYQMPLADMIFNSDGELYVSESAPGFTDALIVFDRNGNKSTVTNDLSQPAGLAMFNNELYIAEYGAGRISKVARSGSKETYTDGLTHPHILTFDPDGNLYVTTGDESINQINKISTDKTISLFASFESDISFIRYNPENNCIFASALGKVYKLTLDGTKSDFVDGLTAAMDITSDASGNIYISDDSLNAVFKLTK